MEVSRATAEAPSTARYSDACISSAGLQFSLWGTLIESPVMVRGTCLILSSRTAFLRMTRESVAVAFWDRRRGSWNISSFWSMRTQALSCLEPFDVSVSAARLSLARSRCECSVWGYFFRWSWLLGMQKLELHVLLSFGIFGSCLLLLPTSNCRSTSFDSCPSISLLFKCEN